MTGVRVGSATGVVGVGVGFGVGAGIGIGVGLVIWLPGSCAGGDGTAGCDESSGDTYGGGAFRSSRSCRALPGGFQLAVARICSAAAPTTVTLAPYVVATTELIAVSRSACSRPGWLLIALICW